MASPISSVYAFTFEGDHALVADLSDGSVTAKHLENVIPMSVLHWIRNRSVEALTGLNIVLPPKWRANAQTLLLQRSLFDPERFSIQVSIDNQPSTLDVPHFPAPWHRLILVPQPTLAQITAILAERGVDAHPAMGFYQNVSDRRDGVVQGRINGLKVLEIQLRNHSVSVGIGKPTSGLGKRVAEVRATQNLTSNQLIQYVAENRATPHGQLGLYDEDEEHYLESKVLCGIGGNEAILRELRFILDGFIFFQFPTVTEIGGNPRYVDILARQGDTPWVIEIKVAGNPSNEGEYYFQSIGQALSYSGYLKCVQSLALPGVVFAPVRPVTLFPEFSQDHQWLKTDFEHLVSAMNRLLLPINRAKALYVARNPWQTQRAVSIFEASVE